MEQFFRNARLAQQQSLNNNNSDFKNNNKTIYDSNWTSRIYFQLMERELKSESFSRFLHQFLGPNTQAHNEVIQEIMQKFRSDPLYKDVDLHYNYHMCMSMVQKSVSNVKTILSRKK